MAQRTSIRAAPKLRRCDKMAAELLFRRMNISQIAVWKGVLHFNFVNGSQVMYTTMFQEYICKDIFSRRQITSQKLQK